MADPSGASSATPTPAAAPPALAIRPDGVIVHDGLAVGQVADGTLVLNLGWCRLAGLSVQVQGDPAVDRQRSGLVLDRPVLR